ncbi:MAG: TRAP transporter substrate-binding protein DctP [Gammaproteobacteria bacterium]|nr:TRAP transporter substrate-binding protein DctP [Gammaproteobacteria bacterium]
MLKRVALFLSLLPAIVMLQPAHAVTFKIATLAPNGTMWMNEMRAAAKTIKEKTNGKVKFRFYPGGVMGSDKSVLRKIRIGQLHGGLITGGGLASVYHDANLYNLPFLFRDYSEVDYIRQQIDPLLIKGLRSKGFVSFGFSEGGFAYMMANKPLKEVKDLAGLKVWIPEGDRISQLAFEAGNVSPLPLPLSDVLTGLQTGLIDTVAGSPVGAIALQWYTQVSYLTDAPLMYLYGGMMVKEKQFKKLSKAHQKITMDEMGKAFKRINDQNRKDDHRAKEVIKQQGIKFVQPNHADRKLWYKMADHATQTLLKDKQLGQGLYDKTTDLLAKYRKQ